MKKNIIFIILCAVIGLSSCNTQSNDTNSTTSKSEKNLTGKAKMLQGTWEDEKGTMTFDFKNDSEGVWTAAFHEVVDNDYFDMKLTANIKLEGDEIRITKYTYVDADGMIDGKKTADEITKTTNERVLNQVNTPNYLSMHYYIIDKLTDDELVIREATLPDIELKLHKK